MTSEARALSKASIERETSGFYVTERYKTYVVWLLFVVYTLNFVDRQILTILMEPIKREFQLSDTQLGLLGGLAFAVLYSTLGLPIARLADKGNRVALISAALLVWSTFTALTGFARSFGHLLFARLAVGVGEAGCSPPAYSLIGDYFEPKRRSTAISIYSMGIYAGVLLGFELASPRERALASALLLFIINLIGLGFGPLLTGAMSDGFKNRHLAFGMSEPIAASEGLRWALYAMTTVSLWSAFHYARGARTLRHDLLACAHRT